MTPEQLATIDGLGWSIGTDRYIQALTAEVRRLRAELIAAHDDGINAYLRQECTCPDCETWRPVVTTS